MAKAGPLNNNLSTAIQSGFGCHMLEASHHGAVTYIGDTNLVLAATTWIAGKHKGSRLLAVLTFACSVQSFSICSERRCHTDSESNAQGDAVLKTLFPVCIRIS